MVNMKDLDGLEELLIEEIHKIVKSGEIKDATQIKAIKEVAETLNIINCIRNDNMNGGIDGGYSGYMPNNMPYNNQIESSGYSNRNSSYGRRNPRMGRYSSSMDGGYSGHSIHDRMIASLEDMYDAAKTQHEKSEIDNWINRLRSE